MAKALSKCRNLKYINFGDCLLRRRGSLILTRALVQSPEIKEIILSYNEISLENGIEISILLAQKMKKLELLDLNGNKFGEDGILEILKILEPIGEQAISTLSDDEGTGGEEDSGDEEEDNSEVVVDGEEDYDDLEDYDEYDDEEEYDEDEYDEEEEDEGENAAPKVEQSNLFKPFNNLNANGFKLSPGKPFGSNKSNLFTSMVTNSFLKTNSVPTFDKFIASPDLSNLRLLDE